MLRAHYIKKNAPTQLMRKFFKKALDRSVAK